MFLETEIKTTLPSTRQPHRTEMSAQWGCEVYVFRYSPERVKVSGLMSNADLAGQHRRNARDLSVFCRYCLPVEKNYAIPGFVYNAIVILAVYLKVGERITVIAKRVVMRLHIVFVAFSL